MEINASITRDSNEECDDSLWEDISGGEAEEKQGVARNDRSTVQNNVRIRHRRERLRLRRNEDQAKNLTTSLPKDDCARNEIDREQNCTSHFMHPPIDFTSRQIRLVRILPSEPSFQIQCEFVLGMVDDPAQPYTALSYAWGTAEKLSEIVKIILNGQEFWIRQNLWNFLHRARMDQSLCQGLFWIDALCIDQAGNGVNGLQEKNHQVNLMGEIYSNAREVISWLGEPHLDAKIRQELEDLQGYPVYEMSPHEEQSAFRGLHYISNCSYWSRIWIVQEVLLAKKVIVRVTDYSFNWQKLCELWQDDNYRRWADSSRFDPEATVILPTCWGRARPIIHSYVERCILKLNPSLARAFLDFQHLECSNALDKIYALLGLAEDQLVMADYNKTPVQLFEDIVRYYISPIWDEGNSHGEREMMETFFETLGVTLQLSSREKKSVLQRFPALPLEV